MLRVQNTNVTYRSLSWNRNFLFNFIGEYEKLMGLIQIYDL